MYCDTEQACELIDACFFSGDSFHDYESLEEINNYVQRWSRIIKEIKHDLEREIDES